MTATAKRVPRVSIVTSVAILVGPLVQTDSPSANCAQGQTPMGAMVSIKIAQRRAVAKHATTNVRAVRNTRVAVVGARGTARLAVQASTKNTAVRTHAHLVLLASSITRQGSMQHARIARQESLPRLLTNCKTVNRRVQIAIVNVKLAGST